MAIAPNKVNAQCDHFPNQYPATAMSPIAGAGFATLNGCNYGGEYALVNVVSGDTYIFSTCAADGSNVTYNSQLTLRNTSGGLLAYNDNFCSTQSRITWISTITGQIEVHLSVFNCLSNSVCSTIRVSRTAGGPPPPSEVCNNNMPASGTQTVTTCSGTVCDPGGTSLYPNSANGTLVINPSVAGDNVRLTFNTFNVESGWDYLYVYDGNSTAAPLLATLSGTTLPPVFTANNGSLTLRFTSDVSFNYAGFNATISCITPPPPGPCLSAGYGAFGSLTPICNNTVETITTCGYGGEYSNVALTAGISYTFASSNATDWITIGNDAGTVGLAFGTTPVTYTAVTTGNHRFYTHVNSACGEQGTCRTKTVQCLFPPACAAAPTYPTNGATLCYNGELSWPAVALASGYDVYLNAGAGPATTLVSSDQAGTTYSTGALNGQYAWRIVPRNATGPATACANWTFTGQASPTASANNDGPACVGQDVQLTGFTDAATYSWSGPGGYTSNDLSPVLSNVDVADGGDYIFTADNGSCTFSSTTTVVVNAVAPAPTSTTNYAICLNGTVPGGQGLTATAPATVPANAVHNFPGGSFHSEGITFVVRSTMNVPAIPAGAVFTGATLTLTNVEAFSPSYRSEIRVDMTGAYVLAETALSSEGSAGVISPDPVINLPGFPSTGGVVNLRFRESFNDGINPDAIIGGAFITLNYLVQGPILWFDAASGGSQVGSGTPFNPVPGAVNAGVGGFTTLYAAVDDPNCPSGRIPAYFSVGDQFTTFEINSDIQASQTTWEIKSVDNDMVVCSGGPYFDGFQLNIPTSCCMPEGCYTLAVYDSGGDGMVNGFNGGYSLRNSADNRRIIDNTANGDFGSTSQMTGNSYSFCMPLGDDELIYTSCDKYWWRTAEYIVATENLDVSAIWVPNGANTVQSNTTGYEFWFYNPNGGYSFRKFRSHRITDGMANIGATRTAHMKINNWAVVNHIPENDLMNVRVRGRVLGNNEPWGPACRFVRDQDLALCPPTKLMDIPGNANLSCGQFRQFVGGQRVYARPVGGATQYQWRFKIPAENVEIVRTTNTYILNFPWGAALADPLLPGKTYEVEVRAFKGGEWCIDPLNPDSVWGDICLLTIQAPPAVDGNQNIAMENEGGLNIWPNPNTGEQFWLNIDAIEVGVLTVAVDIMDLTGKRVIAREIPVTDRNLNTVIDLNGDLATGMYMVNITAGDKRWTERLVIAK